MMKRYFDFERLTSSKMPATKIFAERPDVRILFTDIQMLGNCDGLQLAAKVHERWPKVLLLVTSGRLHVADQDIPDHGRFIGKPYQDHMLIGRVGSLIADQEANRLNDRGDLAGWPTSSGNDL